MRKKCILGLMVILLVFCIFGCDGDEYPEIYTVTIGTLTNANGSTITASPTSGVEGTEITLTINEDNTYRLKSGTLKYGETVINETTLKFILPAENVNITAEFKSLLIGVWELENSQNYIFLENGIYYVFLHGTGKYHVKGIWNPQNDDTVIIKDTHFNPNGFINLEDFSNTDEQEDKAEYEYICKILSNTSIKMLWQSSKNDFETGDILIKIE